MRNEHKVQANGKWFYVSAPSAYRASHYEGGQWVQGEVVINYPYRGSRKGEGLEPYGPIRRAVSCDKPKSVSAQLIAQARELFNADHEAMIAAVEAQEAEGREYPSVRLIQK